MKYLPFIGLLFLSSLSYSQDTPILETDTSTTDTLSISEGDTLIIPVEAQEKYNEGVAAFQNKKYNVAIDRFSQAIEIEPRFIAPYFNRAMVRSETKDYKGAINDFTLVIENDSLKENDAALYHRGKAKYELGQPDEALADYKAASKINPKDADYYYYSGLIKFEQGKYKESIFSFNKALLVDNKYA
ncbi:MAG: tetratricopeptide repeat protein, partial [Flavobacteriales bacterium]|nr:tetratricopeptide repeat protein [Flavobacteriales bacterium]